MAGSQLTAKVKAVMGAIDFIPKRGRNTAQGYDFAMDADIQDTVRKEFVKVGIAWYPRVTKWWRETFTTAKGTTMFMDCVEMEFTLVDDDSGEERTISAAGTGMDTGDKGIYKAQTGATKYALLKLLQIPTGDDPEKDEPDAVTHRTTTTRCEAPTPQPQAQASATPRGTADVTLPVSKSKGKLLRDAATHDLEWVHDVYLTQERLNDPRYGSSNQALLIAIGDELDRRKVDQTAAMFGGMEVEA